MRLEKEKGDGFIFKCSATLKASKNGGAYIPRMGRIVLPSYPHHVVQRGPIMFGPSNKAVMFFSTYEVLSDGSRRFITTIPKGMTKQ